MIPEHLFDFSKYDKYFEENKKKWERALCREEVILGPSGSGPFYLYNLGYSMDQYLSDPETQMRIQLEWTHWRLENFPEECHSEMAVCPDFGSILIPEAFGCEVKFLDNDYPWAQPCMKDIDEVERIEIPDPTKSYYLNRQVTYYEKMTELAKGCIKVGQGGIVTNGPFTDACLIRGTENLLVDMVAAPEKVKRLLELIVDTYIVFSHYFWEKFGLEPPERFYLPDDSIVNISPERYRETVIPFEKQVVRELSKTGELDGIHLCGNSRSHLPVIKEGLNPRSMEISYLVDMEYAKDVFGDKAVLKGNFNPRLIHDGNKDEIKGHIYEVIKKGARNSGFIACSVAGWDETTPIENIKYAYQCAIEAMDKKEW